MMPYQDSDRVAGQQDWIWQIIICPECGSAVSQGSAGQEIVCTNTNCGYRSKHNDRLFNLLPRDLDVHQRAENDFRATFIKNAIGSVPGLDKSQHTLFKLLNTITYYSFTSQYYFFRDYFARKYQLQGRGLEIGGSTGQSSGFIKLFYPMTTMVTSDVAPINMKMAEELAGLSHFGTDYFVMADAERLPFAPCSFDFMFSSGMLHHLGDIQRALAGGYALLKPGGRWYIVNELSIGSIARSFWNSSWGEKGKWAEKTGIRENSYTLREWLHFFEQQNFQILEVHFHRNTKHKLLNWSRAAYYAFISKLPSLFMKMGVPCEVNFVLEKR